MMKSFVLRLLPVLVLSLSLAAGCATTKKTGEMAGEVVPEETVAVKAAPAAEQPVREAPLEAVDEAALKADAELARLAAEVRKLYTVHFDFDKYNIKPEDAELLKSNSRWLRKNKGVRVLIEGHADERGETEYNLALGAKRAQSVKDFLVSLGISPSRFSTISYGEEKPVDEGHNEAAWAKNRRAEFRLAR